MSNTKKVLFSKRCAIWCLVLGFCLILYPVLLLNFYNYSLIYLSILTTMSAFNIVNMNRKAIYFPVPIFFSIVDDVNTKEKMNKRSENREFSVWGALVALFCSICVYAVISILLGAPIYKDWGATLYFSSLMTLLTVYPLIWYYFFSDSISSVLKVITDTKFDNMMENHLQSILIWTIMGAWVGAFPIPLDWDRPWQKWPITCCIGACLGNSVMHLITGYKLLQSYVKDKKKVLFNRTV
ncbi:phosphatidylinositol-glycan biosynthesis class F protein isoform X1 [Parasteatoda tepidariorum]|uniref:phosphatidylinositol-glycan biosynthesis class F protein isoform X1 n=1 Tax=Parasteatoda tepidariorum TaxID=114398 RepID=UPI00077F93D0|nr:phosphatidylinositol-glycan biosynthesis class F protein isoform X2 [Parasteatoda tepidariorum]